MRSSNVSAPCRFELRPSRWLIGAMLLLSAFVPLALLASAMPRWIAWPLAVFGIAAGLCITWRESTLSVLGVVVDAEGRATIEGVSVDAFSVDWRGPLAFVVWRDVDGRIRRRSLWPDTLSTAQRRELRLAVRAGGDGQPPPSMAP
jgi:toxin CptA